MNELVSLLGALVLLGGFIGSLVLIAHAIGLLLFPVKSAPYSYRPLLYSSSDDVFLVPNLTAPTIMTVSTDSFRWSAKKDLATPRKTVRKRRKA